MSDLEYPDDLRYTAEHEWVRVGDGVVRVGITSFAQNALGDVVYVSLPTVGDTVATGDTCGEVESTKSVSDLYAPLAGEITAVNAALDAAPSWSTPTPTARAGCTSCGPTDAGAVDALLDGGLHRPARLTDSIRSCAADRPPRFRPATAAPL